MKNLVNFLLPRLKEKSTWVGILSILTACGVAVKPELADAVATAGAALTGGALIVMKEGGGDGQ